MSVEKEESRIALVQARPGERFKIHGICESACPFLRTKMLNLGFLKGEDVEVLWQAPLQRQALAVRVRDVTFALRAADLALIQVERVKA